MKLGRPIKIKITPNAERTEFLFHLQFAASPQSVEFVAGVDDAMNLMLGLQHLQVRHKIPIPPLPRSAGKPKLRVVTEEDD